MYLKQRTLGSLFTLKILIKKWSLPLLINCRTTSPSKSFIITKPWALVSQVVLFIFNILTPSLVVPQEWNIQPRNFCVKHILSIILRRWVTAQAKLILTHLTTLFTESRSFLKRLLLHNHLYHQPSYISLTRIIETCCRVKIAIKNIVEVIRISGYFWEESGSERRYRATSKTKCAGCGRMSAMMNDILEWHERMKVTYTHTKHKRI